MNEIRTTRLKCVGIHYRSGFIETQIVHPGHINLEIWSVAPEVLNAESRWVTDVPDETVTGNAELELDLQAAMSLADSLHELVSIEATSCGTETSCDECGSHFWSSEATTSDVCPECSHYLYNKPNCAHSFRGGRCRRCGWDGSESHDVAIIKGTDKRA